MVDNGSSEDSIAFTEKHFPWVRIVALKENVGFAAGVNRGIETANGSLIALLNNDTELDENWLRIMADAAARHTDVGFFASKMLDFSDRTILDSCGDVLTWTGRSYKMGELQKDASPFDTERSVFGACAGAAVYRSELFSRIGLFDEDFFAYLEDVDIDFRAQLAGFTCMFIPDARVYHIGSATAGKRSAFSFKMMVRNHFYLIYKNFPTSKLWINLPKLLYAEARLYGAARRQGFQKEYWQAVTEARKGWSKMRPKRQEIQGHRMVTNRYLDSIIEPNFPYKPLSQAIRAKKSNG